jgi:diguanylate cyclase (GGDEF)-like protein/PAS domain S-box-containing protein
MEAERLARAEPTRPARPSDHLVDASADVLLHVARDGTLLDSRPAAANDGRPGTRRTGGPRRTAASIGDLLGSQIAMKVIENVQRALDTRTVVYDVWEAKDVTSGDRSYCQARFTCSGLDEVLVLLRDATMDVCRRDAEQHVSDLGRLVITATNLDVDATVQSVLQSTAHFVGGRSGIVLVPDDHDDFTIASVWEPTGMPADPPPREPGRRNWLAEFIEDLDAPIILSVDDLPDDAVRLRDVARRQGLACLGLIPLVCDIARLGIIAIGFDALPDRVGQLRFRSLGALGPLLVSVRERQQRQADEWLRQAEDRFRRLMHRSADIALGLDEGGKIVFVSPSVQEILGYDPKDLLDTNVLRLVHPDDAGQVARGFEQFPPGASRRSGVFRIRHRNGGWRNIESVLTDMRDDAAIGCLVGVARDVTEQLETQDALRRSVAHIRALVQHSSDLLAVVDADGVLTSPSPSAILGYDTGSLAGGDAFQLIHPDDADAGSAAFARSRARPGESVAVELRLHDSDGRWRHYDVLMTNHLDDPLVGGVIINGHDVTARIDAERERAESEAGFRFLADRASDMIYRFSTVDDGRFEYMSPAAEELTGFTPAEFYADPHLMLNRLHPDDRQTMTVHLANPQADTAGARMRLRMQHKNGTWIWTEHRAVPLIDENGRMVAAEGIARDITEQVHAEAEILEREMLSRSVLESIQGPAMVVDAEGAIRAVNADWATRMSHRRDGPAAGAIGANYLELCDEEAAHGVAGAAQAAAGLRAVLSGAEETFRLDYPVYGTDDEHWFVMRASPLRTETGGAIVHHVDITDRKLYEQQLARHALRDSLTGLANRALLSDRLDGALARSGARTPSVGLLLLDLDRFNIVNDGLGHAAGDDLLVAVSARLRKLVPPGATVARLGGDEFVVLCEGLTSDQSAGALADRIVNAFAAPLREVEGERLTVTMSVGVALGNRTTSGDELLRRAGAAMHHAKRRGRNRFEFFDKVLHSGAFTRLSVEAELHRAIERDEFRLYYQPIIDMRTGAVDGVEALLRWRHPTRGLLLPEDFLGVAEDAGLLVPVGDWVLREACRQVRAWNDARLSGPDFTMSVNVAAQQMHRPSFPDDVRAAISHAGISPKALVLELTETTLMDAQVARTAKRLHEIGVGLSIDDFGTGYSSMSYLKRFAVDEVKIDRSFISGLGTDPDDATIVGAIVNMTRMLGLSTIAEGVETTTQRDELLALGCVRGQGFLFGRADTPDHIDHMLAATLP